MQSMVQVKTGNSCVMLVRKAMGGAKGLLTLEPNSSIAIKYAENFGAHQDDDFALLEVDDAIFNQILNDGVTIRGNPDEEAVLCTCSKTYALKFVSTTNSVCLMPPDNFTSEVEDDDNENNEKPSAGVIKLAPGHMELTEIAPKLQKLKFLLRQRPYKEETDVELGNKDGLYRWEDLLDNVQASEGELREALKSMGALEIEGYWRIIDDKFMGCLLDVLILNCVQHDWDLKALRSPNVVAVLEQDGYSRTLTLHCLETYGRRVNSDADGSGSAELWALNERLVCLHYAKQLLDAGKWKLDDFTEAWGRNVPMGMHPQIEMLGGEALLDRFGADMWVRPFSVSSLPSTPAERFAALFRERPRWEWQDLEPYIRDLRVPGLSAEGLLIKYTRRIQPTAEATPIFSAR